jgi:prevent-host-death family protein
LFSESGPIMQVSVAQIKANFSVIASQADAGFDVVITHRGRPAYRLIPVGQPKLRVPFPDVTALALESKPWGGDAGFVADWRAQNERY